MPEDAPQQQIDAPILCDLSSLVEARVGDPDEQAPMVPTPDGELPAWTDYTASTSGVNRNGDAIDQNTWRLANYRKNPQILWMHDRSRPPIGRGEPRIVNRGADDARLVIRVHWDLDDEDARKIAGKVMRGFLPAGSISAAPGKGSAYRMQLDKDHPYYQADGYGRYVRHAELLEFSIVTVPGDANALKMAADMAADDDTDTTPPAPPVSTTTAGECMETRALLCSVLALSSDVTDEDLQAAAESHINHQPRAEAAEAAICAALGVEDLPEDYAAQLAAATDRTGLLTLAEANDMVLAAAQTVDPVIEARAAVVAAVNDGRIAPALSAHFERLAEADPVSCQAALEGMTPGQAVPLTPQDKPSSAAAGAPLTLSVADRAVCQQLGITEAEFLKSKEA